jgi:hypothetical protein
VDDTRPGTPTAEGPSEDRSPTGGVFRWEAPLADWLFLPLAVLWAIVNVGLYPAYPEFLVRVGTFRSQASEIFPYTWISALALFVYGLVLFRARYRLDLVRSFAFALSLSFAATSLFEIIYQNVGLGVGVGNQQLEGQLINLSAVALALSSVRFWRASRPFVVSLLWFVAGWVGWRAIGYPQIFDSNTAAAHEAYLFNAALKVGAYVVLGLLVSFAPRPVGLAGRAERRWEGTTGSRANLPAFAPTEEPAPEGPPTEANASRRRAVAGTEPRTYGPGAGFAAD